MPTFFIIIFSVYLLGNAYIFYKGWQVIKTFPTAGKIAAVTAFWFMALAVFGVFLLRDLNIPYQLMHWIHLLGTGCNKRM